MARLLQLLVSAVAVVGQPQKRSVPISTVNLLEKTGKPHHLASGLLYGVPNTPDQIPDHFYTNMGFNYLRAGGTQLPVGGAGWNTNLSDYEVRP